MNVFDIETDKDGKLILIGFYNHNGYKDFYDVKKFWSYVKKSKIRELWAHNIEFDFFKLYEYNNDIKFKCFFNTSGVTYIQTGNIIIKDLYNHVPFSLKKIGEHINFKKFEIDYDNIEKNHKELVEYNKRDCEITYKALQQIKNLYKNHGSIKVKASIGSQAFDFFKNKFYGDVFERYDNKIIEIFRRGYKGGLCEVYKEGFFRGQFYKVDVNSMYSTVMKTSYPSLQYTMDKVPKQNYWLGFKVIEDGFGKMMECYNSVEHKNIKCDYYFNFTNKIYPFKNYINYFYKYKEKSEGIEREIYKKLQNALYGKFAQLNEIDCITNYDVKENKEIFFIEHITKFLKRIKYNTKNKYYVNVIWSLFTTAKARQYMRNIKKFLDRNNIEVYYCDTDSFIISGDINKIKRILNNKKLGLFKIEGIAKQINIRGKKFYQFDNLYKCKGIPEKYRKEFFDKNEVEFKKMVRFKEGLRENKRIGSFKKVTKKNLTNLKKSI